MGASFGAPIRVATTLRDFAAPHTPYGDSAVKFHDALCGVVGFYGTSLRYKIYGASSFARLVASFYGALYDLFINFKIHHFKFTARNFNLRA